MQGTGGPSKGSDTNPDEYEIRESSLPPTLLPYLYPGPRGIPPRREGDWLTSPPRSRSQDHGRSLPSASHLLRQTESTLEYDLVISSRSLNASPVNPILAGNQNLRPPRILLQGPTPSTVIDNPPFEPHPSSSRSHLPPYIPQQRSRTPHLLQPPSRRAESSSGIQGILMEDSRMLPQSDVPVRPPHDQYSEIDPQGAVRERKKARRSPASKEEPESTAEEGSSLNASTGSTSIRKKSSKVTVACDFCRGRKLRCNGERPCSNCLNRGTECKYQPGGPRRRGPGKAPKKTRVESRQRQQQQQQTQQQPPDQSQVSIGAGLPVSSGPSSITIVPTAAIPEAGNALAQAQGERVTASPQFPSQSPPSSDEETESLSSG